jgi:hypothetical protein
MALMLEKWLTDDEIGMVGSQRELARIEVLLGISNSIFSEMLTEISEISNLML